MAYELGVDLGTTYTAAAVRRDGVTEVVDLGNRSATIPSVVFLREDGSILVGDAANRRGVTEPARIAREFKRRIGDPTPVVVGGTPYSAEALSARLLEQVISIVSESQGEAPDVVAVTHPANWGPYKLDLFRQAFQMADLDGVITLTEPEAAAVHYATFERVEAGRVVAVFDLGGGTFDATVLRKHDAGFDLLGRPEGIERLGGIDFDEAVFNHVVQHLGGALGRLDPEDTAAMASVARLRSDCVEAKEALSVDTQVTVPVVLPNLQTEVRITRSEFEQLIRPSLTDTVGAVRRAVRGADLDIADIDVVLLVGGSSRIPLVAQTVAGELGRPVALDVHPKHSVAMGAAHQAGLAAGAPPVAPSSPPPVAAPVPTPEPAPAAEAPPPVAPPPPPPPAPEPAPEPVAEPAPQAPPAAADETTSPPPPPPEPLAARGPVAGAPDPEPERSGPSRGVLIGAGLAIVALLAVVGIALAGGDDGGSDLEATGPDATQPAQTTAPPSTAAPTTAAPTTEPPVRAPLVQAAIGGGQFTASSVLLDQGAINVVVAYDSVWVAMHNTSEVWRLDPTTLEIQAQIFTGPSPLGLQASDRGLWVGNANGSTISLVDPASNTVIEELEVGPSPFGMTYRDGRLYVAVRAAQEIAVVDEAAVQVVARSGDLGGEPATVQIVDDVLWAGGVKEFDLLWQLAVDDVTDVVTFSDTATTDATGPRVLERPGPAHFEANAACGCVVVGYPDPNQLVVLDRDGTELARIEPPGQPVHRIVDDVVWVTPVGSTLIEVQDARSLTTLARIDTGRALEDRLFAVGADALYLLAAGPNGESELIRIAAPA
ncbi:MAG: Hsp70 family protein [Actinomycetota bacterium]